MRNLCIIIVAIVIPILISCDLLSKKKGKRSIPKISLSDGRMEFNVEKNGEKGIGIYGKMVVFNYKGSITVAAFVYDENGKQHKDTNGKYCSDGYVCTTTVYEIDSMKLLNTINVRLFLPNDETHPLSGRHIYSVMMYAYDDKGKAYSLDCGQYKQTHQVQETYEENDDDEGLKPFKLPYTFGDVNEQQQATVNEGDKYYYFDMGGMSQEWWEHEDGSVTIRARMVCTACNGRNICNICGGTGNGYAIINSYMPCPACGATGTCGSCHGTGYRELTKLWRPGEAAAYLQAHREVEREYRNQGGSRSSGSSSQQRGIRVKEYSPNYTGEIERVWCDECGNYDSPHIHRLKTY